MMPVMLGQTTHRALVRSLLGHPEIYTESRDDATPPADALEPTFGEGLYWLVGYAGEAPAAIFFFHPSNSTTYEFHCGILNDYRGALGYRMGRMAIAWMRDHTIARKLICWVETDAAHVYAYVRALGFGREGLSHASIQHQGVLKDRYLMGQVLCQ